MSRNIPAKPAAFAGELLNFDQIEHKDIGVTVYMAGRSGVTMSDSVSNAIGGFVPLRNAMPGVIEQAKHIVGEYAPAKVPARMTELCKQRLRTPAQTAQDAGLKFAENHALNVAKFDTIPVATDAVAEAVYTNAFASMSYAEKLAVTTAWPIAGIFAVARIGREFWQIAEAEWTAFQYRIRAHNLSNAPAVVTNFTKTPSLADPLARGTDPAKVAEYVESALETWKHRDLVGQDAAHELQSLCLFVAVACSIPVEQAWELLFDETE